MHTKIKTGREKNELIQRAEVLNVNKFEIEKPVILIRR
jgi:hypothetical protein